MYSSFCRTIYLLIFKVVVGSKEHFVAIYLKEGILDWLKYLSFFFCFPVSVVLDFVFVPIAEYPNCHLHFKITNYFS